MANTNWTDALEDLGACGAAVAWARGYESLKAAWAACERGDWMLWLLGRVAEHGSPEHKAVVATACACARRALRFVPTSEPALQAIELAERWAQGDPTVSLDDLNRARHAAYAAANAAAAATAYAAYTAAYAAAKAAAAAGEAAYAAANAAYEAAAAAANAAYTDADAAAAAAKAEHAAIADLIRERHVAPGETVYLYSGSEEPEAVHPRLRIYRRHDGIQEWAATAELRAGELVPLSGGLRDEDAWDLIEQAVQDGDLTGTVTTPDGRLYTYEAQ